MSLLINQSGETGTGSVTVLAPNTNSTQTLTLPDATDTIAGIGATQTLTNKTLGSGLVAGASFITTGTAVASTSGTSIDFTSIPSWVKRITVMFTGVSKIGISSIQIQLGTGATPTYTTSGYVGLCSISGTSGVGMSTGFLVVSSAAAVQIYSGQAVISNFTGNTWVESSIFSPDVTAQLGPRWGSGYVPLAAALTAIRITNDGIDTFDLGSINILWE